MRSPAMQALLRTNRELSGGLSGFWLPGSRCRTVRVLQSGAQRRRQSTRPDEPQRVPLSGYYAEILSHSGYAARPSKTVASEASSSATQPIKSEKEEREERARLVFGSVLVGPERQRAIDARSTVIAGITVPPKPEEPDNCCMSGCVNCVWDMYRDEMEEWAAASEKAQAQLAIQADREKQTRQPTGTGTLPTDAAKEEVPTHVAVSVDDDGGGRDTNWNTSMNLDTAPSKKANDLFENIPVGIREFMRTEKMLKQKHAQEERQSA